VQACSAIGVSAIDYLLKPFGRERLQAALDRVRKSLGGRGPDSSLLAGVSEVLAAHDRLTRLFIRTRTGIVVIPVIEIRRLETRGDYSASMWRASGI
jgi:two-component system LytT family response regulator